MISFEFGAYSHESLGYVVTECSEFVLFADFGFLVNHSSVGCQF